MPKTNADALPPCNPRWRKRGPELQVRGDKWPSGGTGQAPLPVRVFLTANAPHAVQAFEAAEKHLRVLTADHEHLVRTPFKDLPGGAGDRVRGKIV